MRPGANLSIVSAYFTISAYHALREPLRQIADLRFLFGEPTFVGDLGPAREKSKAFRLTEQTLALVEQLRQSKDAKDCHDWMEQDNIEVRSITGPDFLHGKMYHAQKDNGAHALLGSSNFTLSGLGLRGDGGNVELNLVVDSDRDRRDLRHWFDEWWHGSEDVKDKVLTELRRIYANQAPQFVYYMTLFHLFRDLIDSDDEARARLEDVKLPDTEIWRTLYGFQKDGAVAAINRLKDLNGCILADSVGLGKTFTALAVIKYFELKNERVLVLCPKKLRHNWTLYKSNDRYNPLREDRLRYDVLSHTDLSRDRGEVGDVQLETVAWGNYDLLVIDESHNFRNNNYAAEEGKQTRYEKLINDIIRAGPRTKALLLSATPVNNTLADLRNQISFIAGGDVAKDAAADQAFDGHPLGVASVANTTRAAQFKFTQWSKKPPSERKNSDLLQELGGDFFKLLDGLSIARSRKQLLRGYSAEVDKLGRFPARAKPESIHPPIDSENKDMSFEVLDDKINSLNLALYNPTGYLRGDLDKTILAQYTAKIHHNFTQQGRERILVGMMKVGFLKRLESSVESFRLTLRRTIEKIDALNKKLDAFERHQAANPALDYNDISPDELDDEEDAMKVGGKRQLHLGHIDIPKWRGKINEDRARLEELYTGAMAVDVARDAKLAELRGRVMQKLANPTTDKDGRINYKALIFTAYADTAEYLYKNLHAHIRAQGRHVAMARGSGKNHCTLAGLKDYSDILAHFSPLAKARGEMHEGKTIDVLIATDCISEGQNLQDCDLLINYDIHWNPVRIIQRFGRIDRIGSRNNTVYLVNFWPVRDLDRYLNLKRRVETRMALVDISATHSDNLLEDEQLEDMVQSELQFRSKQLKRLQEEVLDLEDLDESAISLSDFSLEEFRRDLMQFLESRRAELEAAPCGIYAVAPADTGSIAHPGAIFCLRHAGQGQDAGAPPDRAVTGINPLHPHYLVYVRDDGIVRLGFPQAKQTLTLFRDLAAGRENALADLCRLFDHNTDNGADMDHYHGLVKKALQSIRQTFDKKALSALTAGRGGLLPTGDQAPADNATGYELVTWLVILATPPATRRPT